MRLNILGNGEKLVGSSSANEFEIRHIDQVQTEELEIRKNENELQETLVTGFLKSDYDLIGCSLEDVIIEPVRSILIPGFDDVMKMSKEAGALGGGISGSGPSIFMLNKDEQTARQIKTIMEDVYTKLGVDYKCYVTTVNNDGVRVTNNAN